MITCKLHNQIDDFIPYIHSKFVTTDTIDEHFVYLISDTSPGAVGGRYRQSSGDLFCWLDSVNLPKYVISAVRNKKCVIVIDDTQEGFKKSDVDNNLKAFITRHRLNNCAKYILYLTGNLAYEDSEFYSVIKRPFVIDVCKHVWFGNWDNGRQKSICQDNFENIVDVRSKSEWEYKFVSLQQRPRDFRIELRDKLRSIYDKDISICTMKKGSAGDDLSNSKSIERSPYDTSIDKEYPWYQITSEHFSHIKYAVVSETEYYGEDKKLLTEKIIKNLIYPQPFVFLGYKNQLQDIRNLGFKIYDDLINHSYDGLNDDERMDAAIQELERVLDIDPINYREHALFNCNIIKNTDNFKEVYNHISTLFTHVL